MDPNFVKVAPESTDLDSTFFNEKLHDSTFGRDKDDEWYRTTSGRAATMLLQADDEVETIGVLKFITGESEVRRSQSFRPCLFGPASSDGEDLESYYESDTDEAETADSEEEINEDVLGDLPAIKETDLRRNRGCSWMKMNSFGEFFQSDGTETQLEKTQQRMTIDAFGNFVVSSPDTAPSKLHLHFEHLKMIQKRRPMTSESKRAPTVNEVNIEGTPKSRSVRRDSYSISASISASEESEVSRLSVDSFRDDTPTNEYGGSILSKQQVEKMHLQQTSCKIVEEHNGRRYSPATYTICSPNGYSPCSYPAVSMNGYSPCTPLATRENSTLPRYSSASNASEMKSPMMTDANSVKPDTPPNYVPDSDDEFSDLLDASDPMLMQSVTVNPDFFTSYDISDEVSCALVFCSAIDIFPVELTIEELTIEELPCVDIAPTNDDKHSSDVQTTKEMLHNLIYEFKDYKFKDNKFNLPDEDFDAIAKSPKSSLQTVDRRIF